MPICNLKKAGRLTFAPMVDDAFWLCFLRAHADPRTRRIHVAGTVLATGMLVPGIVTRNLRLTTAALVCGYGPAWYAHAFIERNRPATLRAPLRSLAGDYRMCWAAIDGSLADELARANVAGDLQRP